MEYKDDEQPTLKDAAPQQSSMLAAIPASLLPSVLGRLGLGDMPEAQVYEPKAVLRDEKRNIRVAAVRRLGEGREAASLGVLVAALHDPAWEVRAAVVWALGTFGEQAPIEVFLAALSDEDGSVRAAALWTLCRLNGRVALEPALRLLHDAEWQVRETAAMTLGELGVQVPLEPLLVSLQDENAFVRKAAQMALELSHPEVLAMLHPAPSTSSNEQHFDGEPGLPVQAQCYNNRERHSLAQTELNDNLYQPEQEKELFALKEEAHIPSEEMTDTSLPEREQMRSTPHRSRLVHFFNGIAAMLVVGLLISGALLLFVPRHPNNGATPHPSTRSAPTDIPFTPFPRGCFLIPQLSCPHNPFTQLHLSGTIDGYTITFKQAYADANRIMIEYSVTRNSDHRFVFVNLHGTLTIQQDAAFHGIAGGGNGAFDPKTNIGVEVLGFGFDATTIPAEDTKNLSLHLIINGFDMISDPSTAPPSGRVLPRPLAHNPVTFDFSVPFHSGQIVIQHMTVTVTGTSITLERMVATPSETRFYVQGKNVTLENGFSLTDNGKSVGNIEGSVGGTIDRSGRFFVTYPVTSVILDYDPVFESNSVCTFTVSAPVGQHRGPWIFHFVVP